MKKERYSTIQKPPMADDLERVLRTEESILAKDTEIERVLNCCEYDYFAILEITPSVDPESIPSRIKKIYRKKTLLLHPDKVKNPRAPAAFDRLKMAERVLSVAIPAEGESVDPEIAGLANEQKTIYSVYEQVQNSIKKDPEEAFAHPTNQQIRKKVWAILEEEATRRKVEFGLQQRQEAQRLSDLKKMQEEREMKKKMATSWEDSRDSRVLNWRSYSNKVEKKKKKGKKKVLA